MRRRRIAVVALVLVVVGFGSARPAAKQASLVFRPLSGSWRFETAAGGEVVTCLGIPSTIAAVQAEATLTAAPDGQSLRLQLGSRLLQLHRQGLSPVFTTDQTVSGEVSVHFELVVETPRASAFKTIWTNAEGCKGTYPFRLTLLNAVEPAAVVPQAGTWLVTAEPTLCGLSPIILSNPTGRGSIALGPVSSLFLTAVSTAIEVQRSAVVNWKATGVTVPALVAGEPTTVTGGDLMLTFTDATRATATLVGTALMGTTPCSAVIYLNLVFLQ